MCGKAISQLFGGDDPAPQVIRENPVADQAAIDAKAAATSAQERAAQKRRIKASSLLATGGAGDLSQVGTTQAGAKPTLGA